MREIMKVKRNRSRSFQVSPLHGAGTQESKKYFFFYGYISKFLILPHNTTVSLYLYMLGSLLVDKPGFTFPMLLVLIYQNQVNV